MSQNSYFDASNFIPSNICDYFGNVCYAQAPLARIKDRPIDFQVEEDPKGCNFLCTVSPQSDLPGNVEPFDKQGRSWSVTLVKTKMTTFHARQELARRLNVEAKQITYGGLKDRYAKTAQRVHIEGVTYAQLMSVCRPYDLVDGRPGFFIKDPLPGGTRMRKGDLNGNKFTLRVLLPGMSAEQIECYLTPLLQHIGEKSNLVPNAYGKQRLGVRQNTLEVGRILIHDGPEAAIKFFLTDTSPKENPKATQLRGQLLALWNEAERRAREAGERIEQQYMEFESMRSLLEEDARKCNMTIEYDIVVATLTYGYNKGFREVMAQMRDEFSLWVGAYQSFYFNQLLSRRISGRLRYTGKAVPLYVDEPKVNAFYRRNLPEAIPARIDNDVRELFLTARGRDTGPWRQLFIPVQNLEGYYEEGQWFVTFSLRSGSYATTFLGTILDLEGNAQLAADERVCA